MSQTAKMRSKEWQAGYDARADFNGSDTCPFDGESDPRRLDWMAGWNKADEVDKPWGGNLLGF